MDRASRTEDVLSDLGIDFEIRYVPWNMYHELHNANMVTCTAGPREQVTCDGTTLKKFCAKKFKY